MIEENNQITKKGFRILFCDLTHDTISLANEVFPLNIGFVASYLLKRFPTHVSVELCKFITDAEDLLEQQSYDLVAFSNYPWNISAGLQLARKAKSINPETVIAFGGPNFPYVENEQIRFLKQYPEIDVYIFQAGEMPFADLVDFLLRQNPSSRKKICREIPLKGIVSLDANGKRLYGGPVMEPKDLDFIPSPYLNGLLDKFFLDRRLSPMIQTNRGCPFSCTFCADGHISQNKVKLFSVERVTQELAYIAERVDPNLQKTLFISDLNFGMLSRDIDVADIIAGIALKKNYPKYIDATTGKNSKNRIVTAIKKLSGALQMTMAMQSTDTNVLSNIKRSNIRIDDYTALMPTLKEASLATYGEIILGLPGETLASHLNTINDLLKMRVDNVVPHGLMMLNGAELNTDASRNRYGYDTKFRVLTRDFSRIDNQNIIESEEVAISTNDLSFEDYLYARKIAFVLSLLNNPGLNIVLNVAMDLGLEPIELLKFIVEISAADPFSQECADRIKQFEEETRAELWDDEEDMRKFYVKDENFNRLVEGVDGKNLIQSHVTGWIAAGLSSLINTVEKWFQIQNLADSKKVSDALSFARGKTTKVFSADRLKACIKEELHYDFDQWLLQPDQPLDNYKLSDPQLALFRISDDQYEELERQLEIFGDTPQGRSKAYIRIGPYTLWRRCDLTNNRSPKANKNSRPSSKMSSSSALY